MSSTDKILEMVQNNNGTITAGQVSEAGLSRGNLKYLVDSNHSYNPLRKSPWQAVKKPTVTINITPIMV
jgi:hypothetical protein